MPLSLYLPAQPSLRLRVTPYLAPVALPVTNPRVAPWLGPLAVPAIDIRVAPNLVCFRVASAASCESLELPRCFAPPVSPTISFQVAPDLHLPAPAGALPRVTPVHAPSGFAIVESPGRPESSSLARRWTHFLSYPKNLCPSASPINLSPGCPGFASLGSSSMLPQVSPCRHPRFAPRMNLRVNRVTASASLTLDALLISVFPLTNRFRLASF